MGSLTREVDATELVRDALFEDLTPELVLVCPEARELQLARFDAARVGSGLRAPGRCRQRTSSGDSRGRGPPIVGIGSQGAWQVQAADILRRFPREVCSDSRIGSQGAGQVQAERGRFPREGPSDGRIGSEGAGQEQAGENLELLQERSADSRRSRTAATPLRREKPAARFRGRPRLALAVATLAIVAMVGPVRQGAPPVGPFVGTLVDAANAPSHSGAPASPALVAPSTTPGAATRSTRPLRQVGASGSTDGSGRRTPPTAAKRDDRMEKVATSSAESTAEEREEEEHEPTGIPGLRPLTGPLLAPDAGVRLVGSPGLSWDPISNVRLYQLRLFRRAQEIRTVTTAKTSLTLARSWRQDGTRRSLEPGPYRWEVTILPAHGAQKRLLKRSSFVLVAGGRSAARATSAKVSTLRSLALRTAQGRVAPGAGGGGQK